MRRGKPMDDEITDRIYDAIDSLGTVTVERIRTWLNKEYKVSYSWNTIRHHLDKLIEEKKIKETIISSEKRKVSVFNV